jgi:hypothetical protein
LENSMALQGSMKVLVRRRLECNDWEQRWPFGTTPGLAARALGRNACCC